MNRFRNLIAVVVLLGAFAYSAWHVLTHRRTENASGKITIRVGHWLLHAGMREAFDEAAAEYSKLHPDVSIEQIPVPIRAWPSWMRTQLIGGTAPDITGMLGANEDIAVRYFIPLTDELRPPNPYNAGTSLAGVPWVNTFVDGMTAMRNLTPTSGDIHSVNLQINTLRLYYNKPLLKEITGSDEPPADYATLRKLEGQVARYNEKNGRRLVPIASCGPYSQYLFERLLPSQTQQLSIDLSPSRNFAIQPVELARLVLAGKLSYRNTPELHSSINLLHDVGALMSPGYASRQRDDALFDFLQSKAVMICAGSWDYAVFERDGDFPVGIMPVVLPAKDDPEYGRFVLGLASEANGTPEATLGVVRSSKHPEVALDFLRFLTSRGIAQKFSDLSLRTSAIADVVPPAQAAALAPRLEGAINGFTPDFNYFGGSNANRIFKNNLYRLDGPNGSTEDFVTTLDAELPKALKQDAGIHLTRVHRDIQRLDAHLGLLLTQPEAEREQTWTRLMETRHARQNEYLVYLPLAK
ncbi:ABC transporter substrate-binding protein [Rariglobus hedericola]|uniref:Carbohydrate ABC transporter substrate-binding protein n=1 Tax=Rariglobus hedericola TaxID=2597822 RepID=A0A556QRM0_9BACT|nr:ABC transporter substrate-binding protein [Rariglobus hedericola]TSJ79286.1 carbohydrate ABC transporter substrate-binding protein [Rariglobus hedericola]